MTSANPAPSFAKTLALLATLLLTAGLTLAANGLSGTLVILRAQLEGFSATDIGFIAAAFFTGFILASFVVTRLVARVGYVRTYAVVSAVAASTTLILPIFPEQIAWIVIRLIMGFTIASIISVVEAWINVQTPSEHRGKTLSVYRVVDLVFVTASQFVIVLFPVSSFELFSLAAVLFALGLIPVSLSRSPGPVAREATTKAVSRTSFKRLWQISPLAFLTAAAIGMVNTSFRQMSPFFLLELDFSSEVAASFIAFSVVGGALFQIPLGYVADKVSRRLIIMSLSVLAVAVSMFILLWGLGSLPLLFFGALLFGAVTLPFWSIAIAHAADFTRPEEFVGVSSGLLVLYSLGAIGGPLIAAQVIEFFGPTGLIYFLSAVHLILLIFSLLRMMVTRTRLRHRAFDIFLRTSPFLFRLSKKDD